MNTPRDFTAGFGTQWNPASWAQIPTVAAPVTPPASPVPGTPQTNPGVISGVGDYNTMLPRPGGTPIAAPTGNFGARGRVNPKGFLAAILRSTGYPGFGG